MSLGRRCVGEIAGTLWLVLVGCGSAIFAGQAIGQLGVALAFGLAVTTMAYALGHVSGCHLNPAVSVGLVLGRRFPARELAPYVASQLAGGLLGAFLLHLISTGRADFHVASAGLAANGYGTHSPGQFGMMTGLLGEIVLTFFFVLVVMGATDERAAKQHAPIAIGAALALAHLVGIPLTNLSVNPARSTGPAVVSALVGNADAWSLGQVWVFWVGPITGAICAGLGYDLVFEVDQGPG